MTKISEKNKQKRIPGFDNPLFERRNTMIASFEDIQNYANEYNIFVYDLISFLEGVSHRIENADNGKMNSILAAHILFGYKPNFMTSMRALNGLEDGDYISVNIVDKILGFDGYTRTIGLLCFKSTGDYDLDMKLKQICNKIGNNIKIKIVGARNN